MDASITGPNENAKDSGKRLISFMGVNSDGSLNTKSKITDTDGNEATVSESGNIHTVIKDNFNTEDTLREILTELKIMNLHFSMMTDIIIDKTEVD